MASMKIVPNPMTAGGTAEIVTDLPAGTVINLDWDPSGGVKTVTVGTNGRAQFDVPRGAGSVIATSGTTSAAATYGP